MDDMQFAKYSYEIRKVLEKTNEENLDNLVRNVVAYVISENRSKTNWLARELFADVLSEEDMKMFDE